MFQFISKTILQLLGWKITGRYPKEILKFIIIVMPHTSNWDFPLGILVRNALKADIRFAAKHTVFRPPFGWIFRLLGGYPVDRSRRNKFVDVIIDIFRKEERLVLTLTPEGTRAKVDRLKTGFYYIALGAGIPIVPVRFDFGRRRVDFGEPFWPTGDKDGDIRLLLDFFKGSTGRNPELSYDEDVKY